jgi:hypothetical protein
MFGMFQLQYKQLYYYTQMYYKLVKRWRKYQMKNKSINLNYFNNLDIY